MLFDISNTRVEKITDDLFDEKQVSVSVLRLDLIHPLLSGNKLFKLHYFLHEALGSSHKTMLSFGGAYSNHLAATAFACDQLGLKSIGIIRGEKPANISPTLQQCKANGMVLKFIPRSAYDKKETGAFMDQLRTQFGEFVLIPEGGYSIRGARGAALISELVDTKAYSHIALATGTATTLAGILQSAPARQQVIGIPVLKGITDIPERVKQLTGASGGLGQLEIKTDYHFGGYAKKTPELIQFMNHCWQQYKLPLDFVYTAKMFYGISDMIKKDQFEKGNSILCLHTGGLQGNKSLPLNTLLF